MKIFFFLLATGFSFSNAVSASSQPVVGDSWNYKTVYQSFNTPTRESVHGVDHIVVDGINTLGKPIFKGSITFGMNSDTCLFDVFDGSEIPGKIDCNEPLTVGKTWFAGPVDIFQGPKRWVTVTGAEKVELDGIKYLATTITTIWPEAKRPGFHRTTYWYVPEIKGMIKVVHEGLKENGLVEYVESYYLINFKLANSRKTRSGFPDKLLP